MSNKKQSSVEWLIENMELNILWTDKAKEVFEKAKAMHKDEIVEAVDFSNKKWTSMKIEVILNGQQYYNETFGGNNE